MVFHNQPETVSRVCVDETPDQFLNAAILAVLQGWKVLPLKPLSKVPFQGSKGHLDATDNIDRVREIWTKFPDANIGGACKASGFVVVDPDIYKRECGWGNFAPHVDIPPTRIHATARSGQHYIFRADAATKYAGILEGVPGVDIKHDGYIVLPGSRVRDEKTGQVGEYTVLSDDAPAPAPSWVTRKHHAAPARPPEELQGAIEDVQAALVVIPNGDLDWEAWNDIGMATFAASGGSEGGYTAFDAWSRKSAKYDSSETANRWQSYFRSPPSRIGMGSLVHLARQADPTWGQPKPEEVFGDNVVQLPPGASATPDPLPTLPFIQLSEFADREPPKQEWVLDQFIPKGAVTALFGGDGTGKSLLAQEMMICMDAGIPFLGKRIARGKSLGFFGEETRDEIERRTYAVCRGLNVQRASLQSSVVMPMADSVEDISLANWNGTSMVPTGVYHAMERHITSVRPELVVVDNISCTFGGEDNIKVQVQKFVHLFKLWAAKYDCGVLLVGHPAKAEDSQYAGSRQWSPSVRSRLLFSKSDNEDASPDSRTLSVAKANLAPTGTTIDLHYYQGCFYPTGPADPLQRQAEEENRAARAEQAFLDCLDKLTEQGRNVSHVPCSNYAVTAMVGMAEAGSLRKRDLEAAMKRLFDAGLIEANVPVGKYGNRRKKHGIARVEGASTPLVQTLHAPAPPPSVSAWNDCTDPAPDTPPIPKGMEGPPLARPLPEDTGGQHDG